ncbi:MAG: serine hydrolase domain-containing protein [Chloroflexota bacterium]
MLNETKLEYRIQQAIDNGDILSAAIAIVKGNEIIYANGFGQTCVEEPALPVTPDTLHLILLTSRVITTLMILRLVEQRMLDLETPIANYLPGYIFHDNPDYGRKLTLRHLLGETSGLASGGRGWGPNNPDDLRRFVWEDFSRFAFHVEPGKLPEHSNNPILAAHVAEAVTGQYFAELVQEWVLDPLDMQHTFYDRAVAMTYPLAQVHQRDEAGNFQVVHRFPDNTMGNSDFWCISSARDLAHLLIVLLNEGKFGTEQFLTPETIRLMCTQQANYQNQATSSIRDQMEHGEAFGLITGTYKGIPYLGRPAADQGIVVAFDLFPEQDLGVVCLTSEGRWPKYALQFDIYDHLLNRPSDFQYPQPPSPPDMAHQALWEQFEGHYLNSWGDLVFVQVQNEQLTLESDGETYDLVAVNETEYYVDFEGQREPVTFVIEADGSIQHLMIYNGPYIRTEIDPAFVPDMNAWKAYEGLYVHYQGVNFTDGYYLYVNDDALYLLEAKHRGKKPITECDGLVCRLLSQTRFLCDFGRIDLVKADDGKTDILVRDGGLRYFRKTKGT